LKKAYATDGRVTYCDTSACENSNNFISGMWLASFKSVYYHPYLTIDLGASYTINSIFLALRDRFPE